MQGKGHCIHGDPVARRGSDEKADQYEAQVRRREKEESCALDLIYSIIDDSNAAFIEPATTTRATLDLLQSHHGAAKIHTVVQLVGELFNAHLTPGGNLDAHLTRMCHIQNGLVAQARDRHGAQAAGADNLEVDIHFSDAAIAAIILHSLPSPQFSALRTAIFNDSSKKLTTAIVFEQIANKVATNGGSRSTPSPSITALAAQAAPSRACLLDGWPPVKYTFCRRDGHVAEKCHKRAMKEIQGATTQVSSCTTLTVVSSDARMPAANPPSLTMPLPSPCSPPNPR